MNFDKTYEIINEGQAGKVRLKHKQKNEILPHLFDCIDLTNIDKQTHGIVKVTIGGNLKLLDLKSGTVLNYVINRWTGDSTERFITMVLRNDACAIFDCASKKLRILPKNISKTYVSTYCQDRYCLVQMTSGEFSFYHLDKYFTLNVRYSKEEIQKLGGKLHWKDVLKRSPEDFEHLPLELAKNKKVIKECSEIFKEILKEKKQSMQKEEYLEYKSKLVEVFNKRLSCLPNANKSV